MELWIRSQDKHSLMICKRITIIDNTIFFVINADNGTWDYDIGIYKTKERALKVLDEIQNILMPKCIINPKSMKLSKPYEENGMILMDCNADVRLEQLSTYVYEMPEE